ncbi:UNVERIFIED_CONTAM: hypothetical protein Slati_3711600 [Sesamum latifolium]|uniref:DUF4218 domain-containing protein n=1 Tax=Sesamum latifolium TaxID=2727402 RepID=A0AAW2U266_9LAMI
MMLTALMWTINDLPAYGMASGWSAASIIGCPIYIEDKQAFHLQHGRKACYFDWYKLFMSYDHLYKRNKKSFTKNRQEGKIARSRLKGDEIHHRVEQYGTAVEEPLTHPLGYKNVHKCVDMEKLRLHGMKSHDCHVFMQKLIPIAFYEMLPKFVWSALMEARVGGPTQYRWMYPFERPSRNDELTQNDDLVARDIFNHLGRPSGGSMKKYALGQEHRVMETSFLNESYETYSPDDPIIDQLVTTDFRSWWKPNCRTSRMIFSKSLDWVPNQLVTMWI